MPPDDLVERVSRNLANNLRYLRERRDITQARLSALCGVPRSTLANLEAGGGNPTLAVMARLSSALHVSIEELISMPHAQGRVYPKGSLPVLRRGAGGGEVAKLLPDPISGMEIDRLQLPPGATFKGIPHRPGTREYLYCERGGIVLHAAGERLELSAGDVAAFQGDQPHSYANPGERDAVAFSVVTLAAPPP